MPGRTLYPKRLLVALKRALGPNLRPLYWRRHSLARRYLRGEGLEIGALHRPLRLPAGARATYVDRWSLEEILTQYPGLDGQVVAPDIVDDGATLVSVADASQDFVVANHVIEHVQDPVGALAQWARVLKADGVLFMAVPDGRFTFDRHRPLTTFEHLERDHRDGPDGSRLPHYAEFARLSSFAKRGDVAALERQLIDEDNQIHWHVWTRASFEAFLERAGTTFGLPFRLEIVSEFRPEFVVILRKT